MYLFRTKNVEMGAQRDLTASPVWYGLRPNLMRGRSFAQVRRAVFAAVAIQPPRALLPYFLTLVKGRYCPFSFYNP